MAASSMFQPELEAMSRDELSALQLERLKAMAKYVCERNPAYRKRFQDANIDPADIKHLDDVRRLPTMNKEDLRLSYPKGFLCEAPGSHP